MALMAEFRGMAGGGWNTAEDAVNAYDAYKNLIESLEEDESARMRVILGFYRHVAEAVGLYEVPERMMLTVEGKGNNFRPFQRLVKRHMSGYIRNLATSQSLDRLQDSRLATKLATWERESVASSGG